MSCTRQPDRQWVFRPRDHLLTITSLAILLATLTVVMVTALQSPQKDDIAWLLYVARRWLAGKRLYEDLVEVNPPLIIWIYAIPAWIGGTLGIEPRLIATPLFALTALGSAWWAATLLRAAPLATRGRLFARRVPLFALIGTVLLIAPGVEFGQREHLLIAASLPYLALFACALTGEREPRPQGIAVGILAGLGWALKPSYAVAFVALELFALARGQRRLRAACIAAAATMAIYAAAVLVFCPAFLEKAVPLALALYGGTDTPLLGLIAESWRMLASLGVAALLCCWGRDILRRRGDLAHMMMLTLTAFAAASALVFVLQGKDWFYHRLPATVSVMLALLLWLAASLPELIQNGRPKIRRAGQFALVVLTVAIVGIGDYDRMRPWVEEAVDPGKTTEVKIEHLLRQQHARTYIAFSEWIALGFPVVNNTGVIWTSRFDSMWALKGEMWRVHEDGTAPKDWPIRKWVARDFVAGCPDIAVVDTRPRGIDYIGILTASDRGFAQAWSHYHQIAQIDGLSVFKRLSSNCAPQLLAAQHLSQSDIELQ